MRWPIGPPSRVGAANVSAVLSCTRRLEVDETSARIVQPVQGDGVGGTILMDVLDKKLVAPRDGLPAQPHVLTGADSQRKMSVDAGVETRETGEPVAVIKATISQRTVRGVPAWRVALRHITVFHGGAIPGARADIDTELAVFQVEPDDDPVRVGVDVSLGLGEVAAVRRIRAIAGLAAAVRAAPAPTRCGEALLVRMAAPATGRAVHLPSISPPAGLKSASLEGPCGSEQPAGAGHGAAEYPAAESHHKRASMIGWRPFMAFYCHDIYSVFGRLYVYSNRRRNLQPAGVIGVWSPANLRPSVYRAINAL